MSQVDVLDTIRGNEAFKRTIGEYIETLIDCAESYVSSEQTPDETVKNQYRETLKAMLVLDSQLTGHIAALKKSQENPEAIDNVKAFMKEYNQIVKNNTVTVTDSDEKIKEMERRMWYAKHTEPFPEDDDDIIVDGAKTFICPLTKRRLVDPVKAKGCGHVFSREAILNLIGNARQIKCPVAGCSQIIRKNELETDYEMQHAMKRENIQGDMSESSSSEAEVI